MKRKTKKRAQRRSENAKSLKKFSDPINIEIVDCCTRIVRQKVLRDGKGYLNQLFLHKNGSLITVCRLNMRTNKFERVRQTYLDHCDRVCRVCLWQNGVISQETIYTRIDGKVVPIVRKLQRPDGFGIVSVFHFTVNDKTRNCNVIGDKKRKRTPVKKQIVQLTGIVQTYTTLNNKKHGLEKLEKFAANCAVGQLESPRKVLKQNTYK